MKNYTITVNGVAYDVTVEEGTGNGAELSSSGSSSAYPPTLVLEPPLI